MSTIRATNAELARKGPDPERVLAGDPVESSLVLIDDKKVQCGIWQITPGTAVEIATPGMFVVLTGRATVVVDGGPTLDIATGDVCIWEGGERTIWTVHETLRKVYQTIRI